MPTAASQRESRSETINLRIEPAQRQLIDTAAQLYGKSRSAFMLEAAYHAAIEALLDHRMFVLDKDQWQAFNEALDAPPAKNEQLSQLMRVQASWE